MSPTGGQVGRTHERVLALDGVRGLAIALVMLHHFFQLYGPEHLLPDIVVFALASSGWFGVDLFFVLSGFLITGILYDSKGSSRYLLNFVARRTLRIFPLYYAALFVFFVVLPRIPHPLAQDYIVDSVGDQLWFWTYLTNFRIAANGEWYAFLVPNVFWSLAIEEQFYLFWPLMVLAFGRRTLIGISLGLVGMALGVRVAGVIAGVDPLVTFVITPARMDCLALGALLALLVRGPDGLAILARWAKWVCLGTGIVLLWAAAQGRGLHWDEPVTHTLGMSTVAVCFAALIGWVQAAAPSSGIRAVFEFRLMRVLGKYSYSMYIFHGPAGSLAKFFFDPLEAPLIFGSALPRTLAYALLAGLVTLMIAWVTWNVLEKRVLALQARFR